MKSISSLKNIKQTIRKKRCLVGLQLFLSMAHILAVNPQVLSLTGVRCFRKYENGSGAIFVAGIAAFVGSLFMGLIARYPIALAPAWA